MGSFSSLSSIDALLDRKYSHGEIVEALNCLETMHNSGSITDYQYRNYKSLLEAKL